MAGSPAGIHGDWLHDEFALNDERHLLYTIEWADGAIWTIEAWDLKHEHIAEPATENEETPNRAP